MYFYHFFIIYGLVKMSHSIYYIQAFKLILHKCPSLQLQARIKIIFQFVLLIGAARFLETL